MPRFIDLSVALQNDVRADPPGIGPQITYMAHGETVAQLTAFFPGLTADDLLDRQAWAVEQIALSTHNGTHMDAPWHFDATQDAELPGGARPAMTIDELPLDWCMRRASSSTFATARTGT